MERILSEDECPVKVTSGKVKLDADLCIPNKARGLVVFSHGSGSSRLSPRNRYVAGILREAGLATLLIDLLTRDEEADDAFTGNWRFDIDLLTNRLIGITDWTQSNNQTKSLALGFFGSSTGAAAALVAGASKGSLIKAIVSRGGRPDLAMSVLRKVQTPTLLVVGGNDFPVIEMNRQALNELRTEKQLVIVPGATHLFEEPGALEQVASLAKDWFIKHLTKIPIVKEESIQ